MCVYICVCGGVRGDCDIRYLWENIQFLPPPTLIFDRIGWDGVKLLLLYSKIALESGLQSAQYIYMSSDEKEKDETASV